MTLMHYLLLVPCTLLGSIYFGRKFKIELEKKLTKRLEPYYWIGIVTFFVLALLWLSPIIIFLLYTCAFLLLADTITFLFKKLNWKKGINFIKKISYHTVTYMVIAFLITVWGLYNASHPIITRVSINLTKEIEPLRIMLLTDLHLGTGNYEDEVKKIVKTINEQKVDLFVLGGDIFDERTPSSLKEKFYEIIKDVHTSYGSYWVEGNHDLLTEEMIGKLKQSNVQVLYDSMVFVNQQFYLIGRKERIDDPISLENLLANVDKSYPIILVDHEPSSSEDAKEAGIDLQLSGHTHAGQLFPANFFLKHGIYQDNNYNLVVSNGYGNWGVPVRTSLPNELVLIEVNG